MTTKDGAVSTAFCVFFVALLAFSAFLFFYAQRLTLENERLRVMNSTTDKTVNKTKIKDAYELRRLSAPCEHFVVDEVFMLALRASENGRDGFEFGCLKVNNKIRRMTNAENFQYYEAAFTVATAQRDFALQHADAFVDFLSERYPNEDAKPKWKKNVKNRLKLYKEKYDAKKIILK